LQNKYKDYKKQFEEWCLDINKDARWVSYAKYGTNASSNFIKAANRIATNSRDRIQKLEEEMQNIERTSWICRLIKKVT